MSDAEKAYQATPASTLEEEIMNPCIAKNEREWWAAAEIERLRAALREHACECVSVCMNAKHNYGEIDTPDTCKYGRAALALAQKTTDVC